MKRQWDIEELIEHFTLIEDDLQILANKIGSTRLGCALLRKYFQYEGRFTTVRQDVPKTIIDYIARQLKLDLNIIENWNSANGLIYFGKSGDFATNRLDEQEVAALSLHLLQICLVYVNTLLIQRVLAEPQQFRQMKKEDLRALTPLIHSHVTPYGLFRLDLSERIQIEETLSA